MAGKAGIPISSYSRTTYIDRDKNEVNRVTRDKDKQSGFQTTKREWRETGSRSPFRKDISKLSGPNPQMGNASLGGDERVTVNNKEMYSKIRKRMIKSK